MIDIKIGNIIEAQNAFSIFGEYNLPVIYALKFGYFMIDAFEKIKHFESEKNKKILSYNFINKDGNNAVPSEKMDDFQKYLLESKECTFSFDIEKIKESIIIENNAVIKPTVIALMSFLIERDVNK